MAEGSDTTGNDPPEGGDLDFLAARRARRAELGEPTLLKRAEAAEATVRTLETHMASLQARARELEGEQQRVAEQLAEREHEVRRVKQREYAEQQLRVEAEESRERLAREHRAEVDRLSRRLAVGERHARELAEQLEVARRELAEAEQAGAAGQTQLRRTQEELVVREADLAQRELALDRTRAEVQRRLGEARAFERQAQALVDAAERDREQLAARLAQLEARAGELQQGLEAERAARERSEASLALAEQGHARLERIVAELKHTAAHLRDAVERERQLRAGAAIPLAPSPPAAPEEDALRRAEMAEALAAAVERLRARVAAVGELQLEPETPAMAPAEQHAEPPDEPRQDESMVEPSAVPAAPQAPEVDAGLEPVTDPPSARQMTVYEPRVVDSAPRDAAPPWLAKAIGAVAERRDAKLAGELVVELLPAQCLVYDKRLTYRLRIAELGLFEVRLRDGHASVARLEPNEAPAHSATEKIDFLLSGPAAAFAGLAAGGAGRRLSGMRVGGSRRRARKLLAARRAPVQLADLVTAERWVWPGLLLLALAEAIEPSWTTGVSFELGFAIKVAKGPETAIYVRARDGEPLVVSRVREGLPQAIVHLEESAFLRMIAGLPVVEGERVMLEGEPEPLERLLGWADRVQGRGASN